METVKTERITSYEGFVDKSAAKTNIFFGKQALYAWVVLGCAWGVCVWGGLFGGRSWLDAFRVRARRKKTRARPAVEIMMNTRIIINHT